jgi:putative selenium metabolism protein SsnA
VEDGQISETRFAPAKENVTLDARGCWVLPGLIDTHTHLYGALAAGMAPNGQPPHTFPEVLNRIWWRLDKALTLQDVEVSALVGGIASLRAGITTIFDHHSSPSCTAGSLETLSEAMKQIGLRASLAYEVSDRNGQVSRDAGIQENQHFIQACAAAKDPMRRAHFGIHAVFSVSDKSMYRCAEIGQKLDTGFHLHVLEHRTEREKFEADHNGLGVISFLAEVGILGPKTIAAHTVYLTTEDIAILAKTGAWTVHNPKSNMGNGVGVSPVRDLLRVSGNTCLGSDGYFDLPQQMVTASLLQTKDAGDPSAFGCADLIKMVYSNNAKLAESTFHLPFGKLKPGYAADILIIPYDPPTPVNSHNLAGHITAALTTGPRDVITGGVVCLRDHRLPALDEAEIFTRSRDLAAHLWERL